MAKVHPGGRAGGVVSGRQLAEVASTNTVENPPVVTKGKEQITAFEGRLPIEPKARLKLTHEQIEALSKVTEPGPVTSVPGLPPPPQVSGRLIVVNKGAPSANGEHFGPKNDSSIMLMSLKTGQVKTLPSAMGPHEIAMSPNGKLGVAPNYGRQTNYAPVEKGGGREVTLLDLEHETTRVIPLPGGEAGFFRPHGVAWIDDDRVVLTSEGKGKDISSGYLIVLNVKTGELEAEHKLDQAGTHLVRLSPDGKSFFATNMVSGSLSVVNRETGKVSAIPTGPGAEGMEITPDGKKLWVLNFGVPPGTPVQQGKGDISVIDLATMKVEKTIPMPSAAVLHDHDHDHGEGHVHGDDDHDACNPVRVVFGVEDGRNVAYVSNRGSNDVSVVDAETGKELARTDMQIPAIGPNGPEYGKSSVPVLPTPHPTEPYYYVANSYSGVVTVVDRDDWGIAGFYKAGNKPDPLVFVNDPPEPTKPVDWK